MSQINNTNNSMLTLTPSTGGVVSPTPGGTINIVGGSGIAVIGKKTALMNMIMVSAAGIIAPISRKKVPSAERAQTIPRT